MTKEQIEAKLQALYDAHDKILNAEEYRIENRHLRRASLSDIERSIELWERKLARATRGGLAVKRIIPRA